MMQQKYRSILGIGIAALIMAFACSPQFRSIYNLPPHMRIIEGEFTALNVYFPLTIVVSHDLEPTVRINSPMPFYTLSKPVLLESLHLGQSVIQFRLLGVVPIRTVQVDVLPSIQVIPGGHSIGVVLHSNGVMVVGNSPIQSGNIHATPAKEAGIVTGDIITKANGIYIQSDSQLAEIIDTSGKEGQAVDIEVKHGEEKTIRKVLPILCNETKRYRIGLFVRDSAAGVGTLSFYEPNSHMYGALGHIITDNDTNQPIDCEKGKIVMANVSGIQQGKKGQPGEKIGIFIEEEQLMGDIQKNTKFGIYGYLNSPLANDLYSNAIPVASMSQVQTGPAEILTVINGQTIERFSIEIQKVNLQDYPEGKGLIIKVTDPKLLDKTGGIVQGMSGSPIIQNGKMIGAVTHVFVHDPTRGYGCFVDWMLMEMGIIPKETRQTARNLFSFWPFVL